MFDYLQQFNSLPKNLRDQVSSPSAMAAISELEKKYQVDLAMIVMKVMIKSLKVKELGFYLTSEFSLSPDKACQLAQELTEKIFSGAAEHLGIISEMRALDLDKDIDILIKEAGLTISSDNLISRFKNILATYLKGIRSKIDARASLAKDIKIGGLNLSPAEIDRVFKVCERQKFKSLEVDNSTPIAAPASGSVRLDEIIGQADGRASAAEYNLKQALASGQVKPVAGAPSQMPKRQLDLPQPAKQLDLPVPENQLKLEPAKPEPAKPEPAKPELVKREPVKPEQKQAPLPPIAPKPPVIPTSVKKPVENISRVPENVAKKMAPILPKVEPKVESKAEPKAESNIIKPAVAAARSASPTPLTNRPQIHDIKPAPKVMGPTEELRFLDLTNFRRLGKTASEATAKILAKIKLLEKDGYDKMVLGVQAWRQGTINRLYLRLGQEAIVKGITLKEAVEAHQKDGKESLTMEEIEAIVSLNSKLVF